MKCWCMPQIAVTLNAIFKRKKSAMRGHWLYGCIQVICLKGKSRDTISKFLQTLGSRGDPEELLSQFEVLGDLIVKMFVQCCKNANYHCMYILKLIKRVTLWYIFSFSKLINNLCSCLFLLSPPHCFALSPPCFSHHIDFFLFII